MTDSQSRGSVVVGDQAAPRVADGPVVPDAGTEGQQSSGDACAQPADRVGAVAFQRELVLELVEDRLDPLANPASATSAGFASGSRRSSTSSRTSSRWNATAPTRSAGCAHASPDDCWPSVPASGTTGPSATRGAA